jgi:hypothetical protein
MSKKIAGTPKVTVVPPPKDEKKSYETPKPKLEAKTTFEIPIFVKSPRIIEEASLSRGNSPRFPDLMSHLSTPSIIQFIQEHELNLKLSPKTDEVPYDEPVDARNKVYNFVRIPIEVEKFLFFGFFLCLDSFLFYITLLPLRIIIACFLLIFNRKSFNSTHAIDIFKGITLAVNCFLLYYFLQYSDAYHWVRGESAIKLYVIYNILEVLERLASSFGQDIMQSLYFSIKETTTTNWAKCWHIMVTMIITVTYLCTPTSTYTSFAYSC